MEICLLIQLVIVRWSVAWISYYYQTIYCLCSTCGKPICSVTHSSSQGCCLEHTGILTRQFQPAPSFFPLVEILLCMVILIPTGQEMSMIGSQQQISPSFLALLSSLGRARNRKLFHDRPLKLNIVLYLIPLLKLFGFAGYFGI